MNSLPFLVLDASRRRRGRDGGPGGRVPVAAGYTLSVSAVSSSSDALLKNDWSPYSAAGRDPLLELEAARVGVYSRMRGVDLGSTRAGVDARSLPDTVRRLQTDGFYAVESPAIFGWLVAIAKAQQERICSLEAAVAALRSPN